MNKDKFTIKQINVIDDQVIELMSGDGRQVTLSLFGECCSHSFFEKNTLDDIQSLVGEELVEIESIYDMNEGKRGGPTTDDWSMGRVEYNATKITTNKQSMTLDWRNESNGYYSGNCYITGWKDKYTHAGRRK